MLSNLSVATFMVVSYLVILFVAAKVLPGQCRTGAGQLDGSAKVYKLNGGLLFVLTTVFVVLGTGLFNLSLAPLYHRFWALFIATNIVSVAITLALYALGRKSQRKALSQPLGPLVKDLWFGVEFAPSWAQVDLKLFAYQPSLIGLGLLNTSFAYVQYERYGQVSASMILFLAFWWIYLASHYLYEAFMLSMWDMISEKFGFMLVWGDWVLVPFFYSIVGWFLIDRTAPLSVPALLGLIGLYSASLCLFRGANLQKYRFKQNPNAQIWGNPAQTLDGKLLVSGFWGIGRKLNYTGEIGVYCAIALTTGFYSVVPYLLPLWLGSLLVHRSGRDEQRCRHKYGALWERYCAKARFRLIPFIY